MSFLKLKPFNVKEWWNRIIQRPVTMGDKVGLKYVNNSLSTPFQCIDFFYVYCKCVFRNLQALVKGITLRRTKNSKVAGRMLVQLPERRVFVQHVTLSEEEKEEYEQVRKEGRKIIGRWAHFCSLWRASVFHKEQKNRNNVFTGISKREPSWQTTLMCWPSWFVWGSTAVTPVSWANTQGQV